MSRRVPENWLVGSPVDPTREPPEPFQPTPGFVFTWPGSCAVPSGVTGRGRSALMGACAYDAAKAGLRVLYLGSEITEGEFNYRARRLAEHRGDAIDARLVDTWARVRYELLADAMRVAWENPGDWRDRIAELYDVVVADPMSSIASALGLDFIQSDTDFNRFYDRLVEPLRNADKVVVIPDNVGHADDAKGRPKGVSAKVDRADILLATTPLERPASLLVKCEKARSERRPFNVGDAWDFDEATRRLRFIPRGESAAVERMADPEEQSAAKAEDLSRRVLEYVCDQGPVYKNAVETNVKGRAKHVREALGALVAAGELQRTAEDPPRFFGRPEPRDDPGTTRSGAKGGGSSHAGSVVVDDTPTGRAPRLAVSGADEEDPAGGGAERSRAGRADPPPGRRVALSVRDGGRAEQRRTLHEVLERPMSFATGQLLLFSVEPNGGSSNGSRRSTADAIREALRAGEMTAGELSACAGVAEGAVRDHLKRLGATSRRDGRLVRWRLPAVATADDPLGDLDVEHAERVEAEERAAREAEWRAAEEAGELLLPRACDCDQPLPMDDPAEDMPSRCVWCGRRLP